MSPARRCPRAPAAVALLLAALAAGCGGDAPRIPLPASPEDLGATLAERLDAAVEGVRAGPGDAQAWLALGMTYEANALFALARECYVEATRLEDDGKLWHRLACAEAALGDPEAAAAAMRRSLELEPAYAPSHWRLGGYLFDLGDFDAAERAFEEALRRDERFLGGPLGIVRVRLQKGDPETALRILQGALARKPGDPHALKLLRTTLQQAGRIDEAMAVQVPEGRHPAFGRDPWNRQLNDYRERPPMEEALDLLQRNQPEEALAVLEPFVREQSDDLNARAYLAQALAAVGRTADARAALDEALAREPDSLVLLRVLAGLQEKEDDVDGALATLARVVEVAPSDVEGWLRKGTLETTAGRLEDALASLRRVHELDRRAPALLVRIGGLELAGGDAEAAVASFEAARAAGVRENALTLGLARAYAQLGRVDEARALLAGAPELGRAGEVLLEELAADAPR